jgi:hypothetical protein
MKTLHLKISSILILLLFFTLALQQSTQIKGTTLCDDSTSSPLIQTGILFYNQGTYGLTKQINQISRIHTFQIVVNYPIPSTGLSVAVCRYLFLL